VAVKWLFRGQKVVSPLDPTYQGVATHWPRAARALGALESHAAAVLLALQLHQSRCSRIAIS
jgi:hypothetical protein